MKMNSVLVLATGLAAVMHVSAADITGTVTLKGTPPPETVNDQIKGDVNCSKTHPGPVTTHHFVVGPGGEFANVVVMLKGITGKPADPSTPPAVLDQTGCLYVPQILAIQTKQKLLVKNSDPAAIPMHNVRINPTTDANTAANSAKLNATQTAGAPDVAYSFPAAENFLKFQCDVHPWMFAWVTVVDSPYFAVTDKDGKFTIKNVPAGKYTISALHRKAAPTGVDKQIEVAADGAKVDFTLDVK